MAVKAEQPAAPGEHPLMSNRTLRAMYASLASAHGYVESSRKQKGSPPRRAAVADAACWVAPLAGLVSMDVAFGCRHDDLVGHLRPGRATASPIPDALPRLYAAIGAAMTSTGGPPRPVVAAFFERHEIRGKGWPEALALAANLPLLLVVLPRWKGREDSTDLGKLARASGLPAIPVDAEDAIALYRVAYESLIRARAGGGGALIEAIHLDAAHLDSTPAIEKLAAYLVDRRVASASWIDRTRRNFPAAPAKRIRS